MNHLTFRDSNAQAVATSSDDPDDVFINNLAGDEVLKIGIEHSVPEAKVKVAIALRLDNQHKRVWLVDERGEYVNVYDALASYAGAALTCLIARKLALWGSLPGPRDVSPIGDLGRIYLINGVEFPSGDVLYISCTGSYHVLCFKGNGGYSLVHRPHIRDPDIHHSWLAAGVLMADGFVYYPPCTGCSLLRVKQDAKGVGMRLVNPTEGVMDIALELYLADGVKDKAGNAYFAPFNATRILKISPAGFINFLDKEFPPTIFPGKFKAAGILHPNGSIYWAPFNWDRVLTIDAEGEAREIDIPCPHPSPRDHFRFIGDGALAADDCIYFAPAIGNHVLRINSQSVADLIAIDADLLGELDSASEWYKAGGVRGADGRVYFAPWDAGAVLCCIDGNVHLSIPISTRAGAYLAPGVRGMNGCIYFMPMNAMHILEVGCDGEVRLLPKHLDTPTQVAIRGLVTENNVMFLPHHGEHFFVIPTEI